MSIVERSLSKLRTSQTVPDAVTNVPVAPPTEPNAAAQMDGEWSRFVNGLQNVEVPFRDETLRASGLLPAREQMEAVADQFRRVKWSLLETAIGKGAAAGSEFKLIMATSSIPGEGKTFCSVNLAMSLAREKDLFVILVDGDIRKADITHVVGAQSLKGFSDLVADDRLGLRDVIHRTDRDRLYFLPAGALQENLPELCASARMSRVLQELSTLGPRTVVVLDSAPLLLTNETQVITRLVGQVLFVVKADSTERSVAASALELIDQSSHVSCILNQSREATRAYYRYGRYGYGRTGEAAGGA
jgi:protein-tyrosine kinase